MSKTHWLTEDRGWIHVACGASNSPNSDNPADVTCQSCLRAVDRDMRTPEETIDAEARRLARGSARSRAVAALVEEHIDDFNVMWEAHTEALIPEYRKKVRFEFEQRRRWEDDRRQREIAELEAKLKALR